MCKLVLVGGPVFQQLYAVGVLNNGHLIVSTQAGNNAFGDAAGCLRTPGFTYLAAHVYDQQDIGWQVSHTSDLLRYVIFQHQNICWFKRRIEVPIGVVSYNRNEYFLGENFD